MFLLSLWSIATLSCHSRGIEAREEAERGSQQASSEGGYNRPWSGEHPQLAALKELRSVTLMVYADRTIPSYSGTLGHFADEIKNRILQKFRQAGIPFSGQNEAEAALTVSMYLSCPPEGPSCGYHTSFELQQWVHIKRDPHLTVTAITWRNSYTNGINRKDLGCCLADLLTVDALSLAEGFIQDYRTVNPR